MKKNKLYREIVLRIVKEVSPKKLIFFGSRAKNNYSEESDIDLLVIEEEGFNNRSRRKEIAKILISLKGLMTPTDIIVYSEAEIENWKNVRNHIIHKAINEGKILYAK